MGETTQGNEADYDRNQHCSDLDRPRHVTSLGLATNDFPKRKAPSGIRDAPRGR